MSIRSTWRPGAVVRIDDRAVDWMAFSPIIVVVAWVVLLSFGILPGTGSSAGAFAVPAAGLWAFDSMAALIDRARLRATHLVFPASPVWCFATPFVYLLLRRRAILAARQREPWAAFGLWCACFGVVALAFAVVLLIEAAARGAR